MLNADLTRAYLFPLWRHCKSLKVFNVSSVWPLLLLRFFFASVSSILSYAFFIYFRNLHFYSLGLTLQQPCSSFVCLCSTLIVINEPCAYVLFDGNPFEKKIARFTCDSKAWTANIRTHTSEKKNREQKREQKYQEKTTKTEVSFCLSCHKRIRNYWVFWREKRKW